jgi:hypothetical protein
MYFFGRVSGLGRWWSKKWRANPSPTDFAVISTGVEWEFGSVWNFCILWAGSFAAMRFWIWLRSKYNDKKLWDRTSTSVQGRVQNQIIITLKICYQLTMIMIYLWKWAHPLKLAKYNDTNLWDRTSTYVQGRVQHQIIITLKIVLPWSWYFSEFGASAKSRKG